MSVYDFIDMCIEPSMLQVSLYDVNLSEVVWEGYGDELPEEFEDAVVDTYDVPYDGAITLNI